MRAVPNPGSGEAVDLGCTCPVIDNRRGQGVMMRGERVFWMSGDCPLHAGADPKDDTSGRPCVVPGGIQSSEGEG